MTKIKTKLKISGWDLATAAGIIPFFQGKFPLGPFRAVSLPRSFPLGHRQEPVDLWPWHLFDQAQRLTCVELRILAQTAGQRLERPARPGLLVFPRLFDKGPLGRGGRLSQQV
jgi:hypothetical protein